MSPSSWARPISTDFLLDSFKHFSFKYKACHFLTPGKYLEWVNFAKSNKKHWTFTEFYLYFGKIENISLCLYSSSGLAPDLIKYFLALWTMHLKAWSPSTHFSIADRQREIETKRDRGQWLAICFFILWQNTRIMQTAYLSTSCSL